MPDVVKIRLKEQETVRLPVGGEVQIEVDENPTTGYRWELRAEPSNAVEVLNTTFSRHSGGVGAGGSRVWAVRLTRPVNVLLQAFLRRPWEPESPPQESFSVELVAQ